MRTLVSTAYVCALCLVALMLCLGCFGIARLGANWQLKTGPPEGEKKSGPGD